MRTNRVTRVGVTVLSAVALFVSGASPVHAGPPLDGRSLDGLTGPFGVAFQPGELSAVVSNFDGGVVDSGAVFRPGETTRIRTLTGVVSATSVAIDPLSNSVYVASSATNAVHVFPPGSDVSTSTIAVNGPYGLAFDTNGDLYVGSPGPDRVSVFAAGTHALVRTFAAGSDPLGIAIDPRTREVYVGQAAADRVSVFPSGSDTAGRNLLGVGTPYGVAIHPASGRVYVSDAPVQVVRVYEPAATGWTDGADLTGLTDPRGVAIHPVTGEIYVADHAQNKVLVFPGPTMSVDSVSPLVGPVGGGTAVTITGVNIGAVTGVSFGGVAATNVVAVSPTTVTAVTPAHAVGKVDVAVSWGSKTAGLAQAFDYRAVAPGKATGVSGAPGKGQVTVSWTPPADTGGVPVASYTVTPTPAGPACATTATSCTIAGLTNGTKYRFVVRTTNTANLSTDSDTSAEVTPYIATGLSVSKAKAATYKLKRRGSNTLVSSIKVPKNATRVVTRSCTNGTAKTSKQLCTFTVYKKSGKVKVRTKGYRNVVVTLSIHSIPKASAGPTYGPSPTWTRTWTVR